MFHFKKKIKGRGINTRWMAMVRAQVQKIVVRSERIPRARFRCPPTCVTCYSVLQRVAVCYNVSCAHKQIPRTRFQFPSPCLMCCSVLQCVAMRCSVLQCVAVCRALTTYLTSEIPMPSSLLQCVAVCCGVLHCVLQCVAMCCSALQYVAVRCSALQCVVRSQRISQARFRCPPPCLAYCSVLPCVAVSCSVLRCVADTPYLTSEIPMSSSLFYTELFWDWALPVLNGE